MRPRILLFISILATYIYAGARSTIDLSGEWFWRINPFEKEEVVTLPGTMDTNGKGTPHDRDHDAVAQSDIRRPGMV